jgi:nuclear transport factor 2 (NTF2) superfamily protein
MQPLIAHRVSLAYTVDSYWRNRAECVQGRAEIIKCLSRKWDKELEYRLIKRLWAWSDERIAVRFAYEWYDDSGNWFRSYGNRESNVDGLMRRRFACINDLPILKSDRKLLWDREGPRPVGHPELSDLLL